MRVDVGGECLRASKSAVQMLMRTTNWNMAGSSCPCLHEAEQVEPFMNRFLHDVEIGVFRERAK